MNRRKIMADNTTMGKLQRSAHLFYIDAAFGGETPSWFLVGKDVEDMAIELNPDTETVMNIRHKRAEGKKLEKYRKYFGKLKKQCNEFSRSIRHSI